MRIIKTTSVRPSDTLGQLAVYNGFDCMALPEIFPKLYSEMGEFQRSTYLSEMDLQSALLSMEFSGCPVDSIKRKELIEEHEKEKIRIDAILHKFCVAIGYYNYYKAIALRTYSQTTGIPEEVLPRSWEEWLDIDLRERKSWKQKSPEALSIFQSTLKDTDLQFNSNSSDQKMILLYHFFGIEENESQFGKDTKIRRLFQSQSPPWLKTKGIHVYKTRRTNGEYGPAADRESLEKIQEKAYDSDPSTAYYWAQPFLSCFLVLADINKDLQFLNCKLEDGKFKSSFSCPTKTGRLSSKKNAQDYGWTAHNISPKNRIILSSYLGRKIGACDYEQIESRMVAAICYILFGATNYYNATISGDLHSLACSLVWPDLPWPSEFTLDYLSTYGPPFPKEIIKAAKEIAGAEFYRGKSRRDVSKTLGHGSNYLGKPRHMSKQSHIPFDLVSHYQDVYFSVFPEVKQWHNWVIEEVFVNQKLTTQIFNRTRQFFDRPSDDKTIRDAVAHGPQSMAADYTNMALRKLHKASLKGELPIEIFLQKHDELGFFFDELDEDTVIPKVRDTMEFHFTIATSSGETKDWYVPAETLVGWNLAHKSEKNPDGLASYPDKRTRLENPFDITRIRL